MFLITKKGKCGIGWSGNQLEKLGIEKRLAYDFALNTSKLFDNVKLHKKNSDTWDRDVELEELMPVYSNFLYEIEKYKEKITEKSLMIND